MADSDRETRLALLEFHNEERRAAIKRAFKAVNSHGDRIRALEIKLASTIWIERVVFVIVTAAVSFYLTR